ncbi:MAG TPA: tyrosine-type recombinase/integrase [Ktedonobacteraceae bacterium]|nr:tyrosine-type recombinase/integrase [Ktedonobacteraceae bacterium]
MASKRRGHGEGSIYQRKDGRWVAGITLEYGKRKYFYGDTRREVQEKLKVALREQQQGTLATGPQQTLKAYLEQWIEQVHKPPIIRVSTYGKYRVVVYQHLIPGLGHIQLQKLTPQHLQSFYTKELDGGLSAGSVRMFHTVLHEALENAMKWNLVARNVCDLVDAPVPARHEMQPLTQEQAKLLLQAVREHRLETLFVVAVVTGMREGELLALRWQDVDFEVSCLYVRHTVGRVGKLGMIVSEPKTKKGRRKIVLPEFVIEVLKQHRERQQAVHERAGSRWRNMDVVFCNRYGGYIESATLRRVFKRILEGAGLPDIRFHDLRHSAATILLGMGVHPKVVQELLGHSSISITLDVYSHVMPSMQQEAMDKLGDLFKE